MQELVAGGFSASPAAPPPDARIRAVSWNIARGGQLPELLETLERLQPDLLLLQEADLNARRTGRRNVAAEIARRLALDYQFGGEFQELVQGSRESPAYTGQATLCRWPLVNPRWIRFQRQSGFWRPRWWVPRVWPFQVRLGGRGALYTEVPLSDGRSLAVYNLHLESRDDDRLRLSQLGETLRDAVKQSLRIPVVLAGDFNFDTTEPEPRRALESAGFSAALDLHGQPTTPRILGLLPGRPIDHVYIRGPVRAREGRVVTSARGSDHYPLAFTLEIP